MRAEIQKWIHSLAVRIPKTIASESRIRHGSQFERTLHRGRVVIAPVEPPAYTLDGLLAEVREDNLHDEIDFGEPQGREVRRVRRPPLPESDVAPCYDPDAMSRSFLGLGAALWTLAGTLAAQSLVLDHVTLIDGSGRAPVADAAIVIQGERIAEIGPSARVKRPKDARILDLAGKYVVPGIMNLHGHVGNTKGLQQDRSFFTRESVIANLRLYAMYGVTTTTSMAPTRTR